MMIFSGLHSMALLLFSFCFSSSSKGRLSSGLSLFNLRLIVSLGSVWFWVILWRDILFQFPEVYVVCVSCPCMVGSHVVCWCEFGVGHVAGLDELGVGHMAGLSEL